MRSISWIIVVTMATMATMINILMFYTMINDHLQVLLNVGVRLSLSPSLSIYWVLFFINHCLCWTLANSPITCIFFEKVRWFSYPKWKIRTQQRLFNFVWSKHPLLIINNRGGDACSSGRVVFHTNTHTHNRNIPWRRKETRQRHKMDALELMRYTVK